MHLYKTVIVYCCTGKSISRMCKALLNAELQGNLKRYPCSVLPRVKCAFLPWVLHFYLIACSRRLSPLHATSLQKLFLFVAPPAGSTLMSSRPMKDQQSCIVSENLESPPTTWSVRGRRRVLAPSGQWLR